MGFAPCVMQLKSDAFEQDGLIPSKFTGEGADVSPSISWTAPPRDTKGFAVICHDPDAPLVTGDGTYLFVHWVLYNIPGNVTRLEEGTKLFTGGRNDFGQIGYNGPMPPKGHGRHRYYFWVLALKEPFALEGGLTMWQVLKKLEPCLIGMNRLVGCYLRD
ncbi:MAG: YbhB/YbcL family Raf kinase inhibitor-like protein [Proteobacteria bacterium]|nr:YbhB/YbcL family Raf kinase inhibitor-like protein [Pseudomonadota bacterium]